MSKLFELAQVILKNIPKEAIASHEDIYSFVYQNGRDLSGFIDGMSCNWHRIGHFGTPGQVTFITYTLTLYHPKHTTLMANVHFCGEKFAALSTLQRYYGSTWAFVLTIDTWKFFGWHFNIWSGTENPAADEDRQAVAVEKETGGSYVVGDLN